MCFGLEWYYGNGICSDSPGTTPFGQPLRTLSLGQSSRTHEEFTQHLIAHQNRWTQSCYNVASHNCNHFTDFVADYMLGRGIPGDIKGQAQLLLSTPIGQMIMPQMTQMQQTLNREGHSVYGGNTLDNNNNVPQVQVPQQPQQNLESSEEYEMIEPLLDEIWAEFQQQNKQDSFSVLNKVIKNIVLKPDEEKFRTLKKSNKKLSDALFTNETILTLMLMTGFEETEEA